MSDQTDNLYLYTVVNDPVFQERCYMRFIAAALSIVNEASTTASHAERQKLCGALFARQVSGLFLAESILANTTNRANALSNQTAIGFAVLDSDIDFQIASIFTGIATSRGFGVW